VLSGEAIYTNFRAEHANDYITDAVHSRYDTLTINNTCSLTFPWFPTKILHCDKRWKAWVELWLAT